MIKTITYDVPKTAHRYMFQVGDWGDAGHLYIDWVSTYTYKG
ncbi:MAG: family 16 glycosylhydrolase [Microbacterium sp.]|nr:family 16 glycosylhydrolase [Microbacterium sp.]